MDDFFSLYSLSIIVLLVPLFLASSFAVKYARSGLTRLTITTFFLLTMVLAFLVPIEFSSHPKPITMEWYNRNLPEAMVLWGGIQEGVGIFVLLDWGNGARFYKIGWDIEIAEDMQEAMRESEQQDGEQGEQGEQAQGEQSEGEEGQQGEQGEQSEADEQGQQGQGQQTTSASGRSGIVVRYPFLSKEDRAARLAAELGEFDDQTESSRTGEFEQTETHAPSMFYAEPQQVDPPKIR